ncbi:CYCLIC NUCLEOTIDE-GATED ION CHANNEL-LIKE PROTEIN [Salix purpurea]|uniref:CYCLIC NUCLEOTIDE-GATED ION CHANNEL-LIKE PROTEIN n=1 Tax=Salix purpurea TaxID=77065 RepID=A0A9Q0VI19_SALPP|nr:CYCLIC NUCLEOTIDE-GATED ION CHANNEL-LIKE PROTEIN [Salix purpurea]
MEITASVLRSVMDIFHMLHIIFQYRPGRGDLVDDKWAIAKSFLIDILSVLPLPQVVILIITLKMAGSSYLNTKNVLKFVVIFQYVPRFMRIYPLYKEVATSGNLTETAWAGAAFNLFLFMLASQVLGADWYLFSIERQTDCWRQACGTQDTCRRAYLFCDGAGGAGNLSFLDNHCPIRTPNETVFNFGIFLDALQSGVVLSSTGFSEKFFYCFWWGLRNLRCVVFVLTSFSALSSYLTTWDISVAI